MSAPIAMKTRLKAVEALAKGESLEEVAARCGVSKGSLRRWRKKAQAGELEPRRGGRVRGQGQLLDDDACDRIATLALAHPDELMPSLHAKAQAMLDSSFSFSTFVRALRRQGVRVRRPPRAKERTMPETSSATRYGAHHRRVPDGKTALYPSDLTDAEWAIVGPLLYQLLGREPQEIDRRAMYNAMAYVVRSGCAWRSLPREYPRWNTVYVTFKRWTEKGVLVAVHDALVAMWRERHGRATKPDKAIIDSQTAKTTEKGALAVMIRPRN
jgi:transposase